MAVDHTFSVSGNDLPEGTRVIAFRGSEAISKPYRVEAFLLVPEAEVADFNPRTVLGQRATLSTHRDTGEVRRCVHGMWSSIALARSMPGGDALYRAVLAPRLWRLSLARKSRVFVGKTVREIVEAVLRECGFTTSEYVFRLDSPGRYTALDHVCQYRETNLDFVSRRLEHDGIYYYFEHPEGGEAERLVITDSITFAQPLEKAPVRYFDGDDESGTIEGLHTLVCQYAETSSGARTFGYNYLTPSVDVGGGVASPDDPFVVTSWEPSRTAAEGKRVATVRTEEIKARESVLEGSGYTFDLRAGYLFDLEDHPLLMGEYLVTALEFRGYDVTADKALAKRLGFGTEVYQVDVTAIPGKVQFRPERLTARPKVQGMELGVVVAPGNSPYAEIDEHGRYLVQLKLDEEVSKLTPSTRMRMAQPHAGAHGAGMHFPLRSGTEVLVSFVRGDPDSPMIASVVPNAEAPSPVTRENATRNVIHTGSNNRLEMEDQEGVEHISLSTPNDSTHFTMGRTANRTASTGAQLSTNGTLGQTAGGDHDTDVTGNQHAFVGGKVWQAYGSPPRSADSYPEETHRLEVTGDQATVVKGDVTREVTGDVTEKFVGDWEVKCRTYSFETTGTNTEEHHGLQTEINYDDTDVTNHCNAKETTYGNSTTLTKGNSDETTMGNSASMHLGATEDLFVGGSTSLTIGASVDMNIGGTTELSVAGALELVLGLSLSTFIGAKGEIRIGPAFSLSTSATIEDETLLLETTKVEIKAAPVTLKQHAWNLTAAGMTMFLP